MLKLRTNKVVTLVILLAITIFIISPKLCMQATTKGLHIWLVNVVPALFPFFILTRIIIALNQTSIPVLDRFTYKCFRTNNAGLVYFLSLLSGYPIGAKLISSYYENGLIDKASAKKMFCFCSTSGPMFIIGAVGIGIFGSAKVGYVLLLGHIIGSFLNGLLYRGKDINIIANQPKITKTSINEIMFDSINSILMVGGYIVLASIVIQMLQITNILPTFAMFICKILPLSQELVIGVLSGIIEITNGLVIIGSLDVSITLKIIVASFIIAFSGICIMMQSVSFLDRVGLKTREMIVPKITQAIFSLVSTYLLVILIY